MLRYIAFSILAFFFTLSCNGYGGYGSAFDITPFVGKPSVDSIVYKPFASEYDDKFSLGDFHSPFLFLLDIDPSRLTLNEEDSKISLGNSEFSIKQTNYKGSIYLGLDDMTLSRFESLSNEILPNVISLSFAELEEPVIFSDKFKITKTPSSEIYTWQDLQSMQFDLAQSYILKNSITLPNPGSADFPTEGFTPIGNELTPFEGSFDGDSNSINNLFIDGQTNNIGLFGVYRNSTGAQIKDLLVSHNGINGGDQVGALVGTLENGEVRNVVVQASSQGNDINITGRNNVGTIIGLIRNGSLKGYSTANSVGDRNVGGLVGSISQGTIHGYALGSTTGNYAVGGLVGSFGNLENSNANVVGYAIGEVNNSSSNQRNQIGGVIGEFLSGDTVVGYWSITDTTQDLTAGGVGLVGVSNTDNVELSSNGSFIDQETTFPIFDDNEFTSVFRLPNRSRDWPTLINFPLFF